MCDTQVPGQGGVEHSAAVRAVTMTVSKATMFILP
jgi:hypothetical protein